MCEGLRAAGGINVVCVRPSVATVVNGFHFDAPGSTGNDHGSTEAVVRLNGGGFALNRDDRGFTKSAGEAERATGILRLKAVHVVVGGFQRCVINLLSH